MSTQKDILRSAYILIQLHDSSAANHAISMMQEFKSQGNEDAAAAWNAIHRAIEELQNTEPPKKLN